MTNPYQSPAIENEAGAAAQHTDDDKRTPLRGTGQMFFLGGLVGALVGGASGVFGAGLLGWAFAAVHPQAFIHHHEDPQERRDDRAALVIVGGALGGEVGCLAGVFLGAVMGIVAASCSARRRRSIRQWTMAGCAVVGLAGGLVGAAVLVPMALPGASWIVWIPIGAAIGVLAGAAGGWIMARVVLVLCYGTR
jgi:hypothetical protein